MKISIEKAQKDLEEIIEMVLNGEEVFICSNDGKAAKLEPINETVEEEKMTKI